LSQRLGHVRLRWEQQLGQFHELGPELEQQQVGTVGWFRMERPLRLNEENLLKREK